MRKIERTWESWKRRQGSKTRVWGEGEEEEEEEEKEIMIVP
jgi:NADPH-dependent glutamate synthase beta subunit-like oxidoreductase